MQLCSSQGVHQCFRLSLDPTLHRIVSYADTFSSSVNTMLKSAWYPASQHQQHQYAPKKYAQASILTRLANADIVQEDSWFEKTSFRKQFRICLVRLAGMVEPETWGQAKPISKTKGLVRAKKGSLQGRKANQ